MEELLQSKHLQEEEREILEYLKRSITDIARKCHVCDTLVVKIIKKYIK